MPLTDKKCFIACFSQHRSHGRLIRRKPDGTVPGRPLKRFMKSHLRTGRIFTSHESRTGWRANWCCGISVHELHSLCSQSVDVRRLVIFLSITTQISITHIICHYIDDVWTTVFLLRLKENRSHNEENDKRVAKSHKKV